AGLVVAGDPQPVPVRHAGNARALQSIRLPAVPEARRFVEAPRMPVRERPVSPLVAHVGPCVGEALRPVQAPHSLFYCMRRDARQGIAISAVENPVVAEEQHRVIEDDGTPLRPNTLLDDNALDWLPCRPARTRS